MSAESVKMMIGDKIVVLKLENIYDYLSSVDVDDLLTVDYSNIIGELLTFPVIFNRIGILKADAEDYERKLEFEISIKSADISEINRKGLRRPEVITGGIKKVKEPTKDEVQNSVLKDPVYQAKYQKLLEAKRNVGYMDSLYWSAKSKDKKLDKISEHITPEEFEKEIMEGTINGVQIKINERRYKTKVD